MSYIDPTLFGVIASFVPISDMFWFEESKGPGKLWSSLAGNSGYFTSRTLTNGLRETRRNGLLHSQNDEPAIIYPSGARAWYQKGKLHREGNLPAVIDEEGDHYWYQNDELLSIGLF